MTRSSIPLTTEWVTQEGWAVKYEWHVAPSLSSLLAHHPSGVEDRCLPLLEMDSWPSSAIPVVWRMSHAPQSHWESSIQQVGCFLQHPKCSYLSWSWLARRLCEGEHRFQNLLGQGKDYSSLKLKQSGKKLVLSSCRSLSSQTMLRTVFPQRCWNWWIFWSLNCKVAISPFVTNKHGIGWCSRFFQLSPS